MLWEEQSTNKSAQARQQQTKINTFIQDKGELWDVISLLLTSLSPNCVFGSQLQ